MAKKKKFILIGPTSPPFNGQSVSFDMLIDGFKEKGLDFKIVDISSRISNNSPLRSLIRVVEYLGIYLVFLYSILGLKNSIYLTISQGKAGFMRDLIFIWTASLLGHKITLHLKGGNYDGFYSTQSKPLQYLIKKTLIKADKIIVLGKSLKAMFNFEPRLESKIVVVNNGLPSVNEKIENGIYKLKRTDNKISVLFMSNLVETKGYFELLEALKLLKDIGKKFECHFAGEFLISSDDNFVKNAQQAKNDFFDKIDSLGLKNEVEFHGVLSGVAKKKLLQRSDVFVLPTQYINEGQPVSIIEAMSFGVVPIATNFRAIPEQIIHDVSGFLLPSNSPTDIFNALRVLAENPKKLRSMSKRSYELYSQKFTRNIHLRNMFKVLE